MITVIWDMRVKPDVSERGLAIIRKIWDDMRTKFQGYVDHRLLVDADQRGHFIVVSNWVNRDLADQVRDQYANAEPVRQLQPLLAEARVRTVLSEVG